MEVWLAYKSHTIHQTSLFSSRLLMLLSVQEEFQWSNDCVDTVKGKTLEKLQ